MMLLWKIYLRFIATFAEVFQMLLDLQIDRFRGAVML